MKDMIDLWKKPATIQRNNFKFKSLSAWSYNIAVGCVHSCGFCYVPEVSTRKMDLKEYGVTDADHQWGEYVLIRPWDNNAFNQSLRKAENTPIAELPADGNRAVMLCTTTDPYQVIKHKDPERQRELNFALEQVVTNALMTIRGDSTLNVRILTRSPLAKRDFPLMKAFGNRLLFGMSLPTLNNKLARVYEPHAPAPSQRLATLRAAKEAGLNVFVAMAPTYPECDSADLEATLRAIAELDPVTVFHEPINIRADNVGRFEKLAAEAGVELKPNIFDTKKHWACYSIAQMFEVEKIAYRIGNSFFNRLHLWPDQDLEGLVSEQWLNKYWLRVSEWPK